MKKAEIITIGDEILIGQIIDTNSAWLAQKLNEHGVAIRKIQSISDTEEEIHAAVDSALKQADIILMTGGLGPTKDDKTKQSLANYFGVPLSQNPQALEHLKALFARWNRTPNDGNISQTYLPENAEYLENDLGTAPGMLFTIGGKILVSMPGVPYEMKNLMNRHVLPRLINEDENTRKYKVISVYGIPESELSDILSEIEDQLPSNISLAYLPHYSIVRLRFTAIGKSQSDPVFNQLHALSTAVKTILGDAVMSEDDRSLPEEIGRILKEKNLSLSVAESCTGGYLSHALTVVPGSSAFFLGGIIGYDNNVKIKSLDVAVENIVNFGAVSEQVVSQMAEGAQKQTGSDIAIASSGVAGPGGGTEEKPVGLVYLAIAYNGHTTVYKTHQKGNRQQIIERSTLFVLNNLRLTLS